MSDQNDLNPYQPPRDCEPPIRGEWFGAVEELECDGKIVRIYIDLLFGLETYRVDGREVLRLRSFSLWGMRRIPLGDGKHLEFRYSTIPYWKADAWFEGRCVKDRLLAIIHLLHFCIIAGVVIVATIVGLGILNI